MRYGQGSCDKVRDGWPLMGTKHSPREQQLEAALLLYVTAHEFVLASEGFETEEFRRACCRRYDIARGALELNPPRGGSHPGVRSYLLGWRGVAGEPMMECVYCGHQVGGASGPLLRENKRNHRETCEVPAETALQNFEGQMPTATTDPDPAGQRAGAPLDKSLLDDVAQALRWLRAWLGARDIHGKDAPLKVIEEAYLEISRL